MKRILIFLFINLASFTAFVQINSETPIQNISTDSAVVYRLFSTRNKWTFIKLNTRNGQMWQVKYSLQEYNREDPLSLTVRVSKEEEKNGRFFLYPTQNI